MGKLIFAVFAILAMLFGLAFTAKAASFSGKQDECANLSAVAVEAAQLRDQGVPWEAYVTWLDAQLEYATGMEGSYIETKADADYVRDLFKRVIFDEKGDASAAGLKVLNSCMKTDARLVL